ncbi:MAG: response regulator, partial [Bdellovibrionia bacterium]
DDEPDLREIICKVFQKEGATTLSASNGAEAYTIVATRPVDAVISDVRMSGGDGIKLLERLRARDPVSPTVFLITGFCELTEKEILAKGAEAVLTKPFTRDQLTQAVVKSFTSEKIRRAGTGRIELDSEISLRLKSLKLVNKARTVNIGRGGLFIALDEELPRPGDKISFEINVNEGESSQIAGNGLVRWVRTKPEGDQRCGFGLEFHELSPSSLDELLKLIDREKAKTGIPSD